MTAVRKSSPRPWGCFSPASQQAACSHVFPTPVGVFPIGFRKRCWPRCLPHARGGVSAFCCFIKTPCSSSPRPWGCFYQHRGRIELRPENPAYSPIVFQEGRELLVWGVVIGVVRRYAARG